MDLVRFRKGDPGYLEELIRQHGPLVLTLTRAYARDSDHADDLFQEVWRRVLAKRSTFGGRGSFRGWLHRIATHVCASDHRAHQIRLRKTKNVAVEEPTVVGWTAPDPLDETERNEVYRRLHRALGKLSDREHEAVSLRVLEGRSPDETAEIMGVSRATVRSHIRHAVHRLRSLMEDPEDELS